VKKIAAVKKTIVVKKIAVAIPDMVAITIIQHHLGYLIKDVSVVTAEIVSEVFGFG
jgi:hypothetical protein